LNGYCRPSLMFYACSFNVFYISKNMFLMFFNLQINVFNIYDLECHDTEFALTITHSGSMWHDRGDRCQQSKARSTDITALLRAYIFLFFCIKSKFALSR